jgi:hypothetical protein
MMVVLARDMYVYIAYVCMYVCVCVWDGIG